MHDIDPMSTVASERLRALPDETAEPYGWSEFRRRASGAVRIEARHAAAQRTMKAAAAVLLFAGATALTVWMWGGSTRPASLSSVTEPTASRVGATSNGEGRSEAVDPRMRAAELWLAREPAEPAMVRVGAYAAVAGLEDRIAQLDDLLSNARAEGVKSANLSPLEAQRARLVSSLAQVRFAETLVAESSP